MKISYKLFEVKYGYDPLFDISTFPTLLQLAGFFGGIQHCVTIVGKFIFDRNIPFALPFTHDNLDCC